MATRLLDTNVVAYLLEGQALGARYLPHLRGHTLAVSFMTVAEFYEWGACANWGPGRFARLDMTLRKYLVIPSTPYLCQHWAGVRFESLARQVCRPPFP